MNKCGNAIMVVICAFVVSFSQNARMDALEGMFVINDRSDILRNPSCLLEYPNTAQATFTESGISPILVSKELTPSFTIGITYVAEGTLTEHAYRELASQINRIDEINFGVNAIRSYPHILLGYLLDESTHLGIELFYEGKMSSGSVDQKEPNSSLIVDYSGMVVNPGVRIGITFFGTRAKLSLLAGASIPFIKGKYEKEKMGRWGSPKGMSAFQEASTEMPSAAGVFGSELQFPSSMGNLTFGLFAEGMRYQQEFFYEGRTIDPDSLFVVADGNLPAYTTIETRLYGGNVFDIEGTLLGLEIGTNILINKRDSEATPNIEDTTLTDADDISISGMALSGFEKQWESKKKAFVSAFTIRGGIGYHFIAYSSMKRDGTTIDQTETIELVSKGHLPSDGFSAHAGVGLRIIETVKLDVLANLAEWSGGVMNGPNGIATTVSVDY